MNDVSLEQISDVVKEQNLLNLQAILNDAKV